MRLFFLILAMITTVNLVHALPNQGQASHDVGPNCVHEDMDAPDKQGIAKLAELPKAEHFVNESKPPMSNPGLKLGGLALFLAMLTLLIMRIALKFEEKPSTYWTF